ncbi:hypothetical protein ACN38_g7455 [Penicillium nordicum]|uniref:C2H2-type domain-containing protein n=1 Tax=Penicillium nordicum TaxID=229535 RepID=A0A0M9WEE0_9EURO|nr:hypothetical protein ACN38_g7455 [Penicillium nordicum]
MPQSLDDLNLDDPTLNHLFQFDLTTLGSIYPQTFRAHRPPVVADTSMAPAYQPRYNPYEESMTPHGGHVAPTALPTHRRPNQNIQYHTVSGNDPRAVAIPFHDSADHFSRTALLVAPPLPCPEQNQNNAQYFAPGAISNGFANNKAPRSPNHGHEQANPDNIIRCDWPDCSYRGTFTKKGSLKRHRDEQHTSPRSFPCLLCENVYSRKSHMADHQLKTHGIRA